MESPVRREDLQRHTAPPCSESRTLRERRERQHGDQGANASTAISLVVATTYALMLRSTRSENDRDRRMVISLLAARPQPNDP
jgi:hypothetical protein